MHAAGSSSQQVAQRPGGLVAYVATWLVAGALVSLLAVTLIHGAGDVAAPAVPVPPVHEFALGTAARKAGCHIAVRPALAPPLGLPGPAGVSGRPLAGATREAALRRGLIVIEYRGLDDATVDQLKTLQQDVPRGTLLAPGPATEHAQLTVSSFRRRLSCAQMTPAALDALRLFRGRYIGAVRLR